MATRKPPAAAWKPGQSGNPKGRPPGTGDVAKLRAAIAGNVPAILESLTTAALAGDVQAARLFCWSVNESEINEEGTAR
ncbi:MAG TPA: DUF5681 domain-containing protein [Alicycliphilus sp.]|nr:DUF5681 domain-containing protein [Alicycliphilus sp.]